MSYPRIREAPESSSAATLRAVAAALNNAWHAPYPPTPAEKRLARLAHRLPRALVQRLLARTVRKRALEPNLSRYVKTSGLAKQALAHYKPESKKQGYPAIIIGAPNGGVAYLAALMGAPFLPAWFLLSFADRTDPDDVEAYHEHGSHFIDAILAANPDLLAVNHYDPIHDRFLVAEANHVRLKMLALPEAYKRFISRHLAPDGALFYVNNNYPWQQFQVNDRHTFQVGGLGGFSAQDYLEGSETIDAWLAQQKSEHRGGWNLPDYELTAAPESEWGSLPQFRASVKAFADANGYQFRAINGAHPEDFGALAYTAYLWEGRMHERRHNGVLLECFGQINPTAALRADLLPLWAPFNTQDSLDYFARMSPYLPKGTPVIMALMASFIQTPDLPPARDWEKVAQKYGDVTWIGANPQRYPVDIAAFIDYAPDLQQWVAAHPGQQQRPSLKPEEFLDMMSYLAKNGSRLFTHLLNWQKAEEEENAV